MTPTLYLACALLVVVVARKFAPILASGLGILVAIGLGGWGIHTYRSGGDMAFLGKQIPFVAFFGFVLVLLAFESLNFYFAIQRRRRLAIPPSEDTFP